MVPKSPSVKPTNTRYVASFPSFSRSASGDAELLIEAGTGSHVGPAGSRFGTGCQPAPRTVRDSPASLSIQLSCSPFPSTSFPPVGLPQDRLPVCDPVRRASLLLRWHGAGADSPPSSCTLLCFLHQRLPISVCLTNPLPLLEWHRNAQPTTIPRRPSVADATYQSHGGPTLLLPLIA
jgi:hypothetical protein